MLSRMSLLTRGVQTIRQEGIDRAILLTVRYVSYRIGYHDRIGRLPPRLAGLLSNLTTGWVRLVINLLHRAQPNKYTDADPYRLLYVDPVRIERISGLHDRKRRGWVIDGSWDRNEEQFMDLPVPQSIYQYYEMGEEWEDTPLVDEYENKQQFEQKCEKIQRLYEEIDRNGFKSQRELVTESPKSTWEGVNATMAPYTNEITIDIGRNGELLWNMLGKHRLAIAKVLGIEHVPVLVFSRHSEWQEFRHRYGDFEDGDKITHPDVVEL